MLQVLQKMAKVNPTRKPTGRCMACAGETANFLLRGEDYEPVNVSKTGSTSEEEVLGNFPKTIKVTKGDELITWLQDVQQGTVLIAQDPEDHVFNIVKTYEGENYVIDSDIFKAFRVRSDENFQIMAPGENGRPEPYHYINDREGAEIDIFTAGKAHEYWAGKIRY
jgi:hypothetical protein